MTPAAPPAAHQSVAVVTHSADETRALAAARAARALPGDRIALLGPLGAGKTQFAKGFAAGLGVREVVNSPSFTLMAEYTGRLPLFHQDLYRVSGADEAIAGGLIDERQAEGVTLRANGRAGRGGVGGASRERRSFAWCYRCAQRRTDVPDQCMPSGPHLLRGPPPSV